MLRAQLAALCVHAPHASAGDPLFAISWATIDGGGGTSAGGAYTLSGTIGQHDASTPMTGGNYTLTGGFWPGAAAVGPCNAADLAAPFGLLDLADVVAFVTAFTGMDPLADLNPDGLFDLADVIAFVTAFNAGCP